MYNEAIKIEGHETSTINNGGDLNQYAMPNGKKGIIMANTIRKNAVRFTINFIDQTITGTKASFNKAGKGYGPEYEELAEKMANHPGFQMVIKEQKRQITRAKRTYDGMDFSFMEDFIATQVNAEVLKKEYEAVKQKAVDCGTRKYPLTKKWFLGKFSTEEKPFDMKEAKEAITQFRIAQAEKMAASTLSLVSAVNTDTQTEDIGLDPAV